MLYPFYLRQDSSHRSKVFYIVHLSMFEEFRFLRFSVYSLIIRTPNYMYSLYLSFYLL